MMTIILIILASAYYQIIAVNVWLFIFLYAGTFFFANFGPNSVTFIQPVELFETRFRSTLHGICAGSGACPIQGHTLPVLVMMILSGLCTYAHSRTSFSLTFRNGSCLLSPVAEEHSILKK